MGSIDINSTSENSDFDVNFYRTFYNDLNGLSDSELIQHYNKFGKKEHRFTSKKKLDDLIATTGINDFDFEFYRSYYEDLNNFGIRKLIKHYNQFGKKENRITSKKNLDHLIALTGVPDFDFKFYKSYYEDLNNMDVFELVNHYNIFGKKEKRVTSQKQLDEEINLFYTEKNEDFMNFRV